MPVDAEELQVCGRLPTSVGRTICPCPPTTVTWCKLKYMQSLLILPVCN